MIILGLIGSGRSHMSLDIKKDATHRTHKTQTYLISLFDEVESLPFGV